MISVENFYWILFENLLRPSGIDAWYHYPFGTTHNLSRTEFMSWIPSKQEHHVLFHYDQEPLWSENLSHQYDLIDRTWSVKLLRILANSEKSDEKNRICKNRGVMDWYYFFHGFAALDWYRDARFIEQVAPFTKVFSSMSHLIRDKRSYRLALTARLLEKELGSFGDISFHGSIADCEKEIADPYSQLGHRDRVLIDKNIMTRHLPLVADCPFVDSKSSAHFGHQEYRFLQRSFLHLVNETVFYDQKLHLTEKTFKPIVTLRPFVLVGAPGNLEYLRSYGFQTFEPWIDESYDIEPDPSRRLDMITAEIEKLCSRSMLDLHRVYKEMSPVLEHNKKHFYGEFRKIIVDELVDNFETCLRIWNNGRVDGRERPLPGDPAAVKNLLLR